MPSYDPQRTRSRRRVADEDSPAPVDALLGPIPDEQPRAADPHVALDPPSEPAAGGPVAPPSGLADPSPQGNRGPLVVDLDRPAPAEFPRRRGAATLWALAVVSVVVNVLVYLWWRRRRSSG